jgi:hypothetical protein
MRDLKEISSLDLLERLNALRDSLPRAARLECKFPAGRYAWRYEQARSLSIETLEAYLNKNFLSLSDEVCNLLKDYIQARREIQAIRNELTTRNRPPSADPEALIAFLQGY